MTKFRHALDMATRAFVQLTVRHRGIHRGPRHTLPAPLVVSLTSYPPRFPTLHLTLRSILNQSISPDEVILWIAEEDMRFLPQEVLSLQEDGLRVRPCDNLRSYKKIVPLLEERSDCYILIADDDAYYPPTWISQIAEEACVNHRDIHAYRAHGVGIAGDGVQPYSQWPKNLSVEESLGAVVFPTGIGGVLYPPGIFHGDVVKRELFQQACPTADDVWLFWMASLAGAGFRKVGTTKGIVTWLGTQRVGLSRVNTLESQDNDLQITSMIQRYGVPF